MPIKISNLSLYELCSKKEIPTKAEERSKILFRTQDPHLKTGTIQNPRQNSQLIHDSLCVQNLPIRSIYPKHSQSLLF